MSGVFHAAILFLVAAGLQVVFGVQKIFNLACGSFYALGAYAGVSAVTAFTAAGGPPALFIVPLVVAGLSVGLVGAVVERGLLRFVYDRDETFQLLLTFALVLMMEDAIRLTWGTAPRSTEIGRASCREGGELWVDGIRDTSVTGVQTCALPISAGAVHRAARRGRALGGPRGRSGRARPAALRVRP